MVISHDAHAGILHILGFFQFRPIKPWGYLNPWYRDYLLSRVEADNMASTYFEFPNGRRITGIWTQDLLISKPTLYRYMFGVGHITVYEINPRSLAAIVKFEAVFIGCLSY